ncbi:MAG: prephenate dehydratase [Pseudomonadota bacterium]
MPAIAFQGELGAYSHEACQTTHPNHDPVPCPTFEDVVETVRNGRADLAMLPVENTTYGRVADIHRLLPQSELHIIEEAFLRVHVNLLGVPGAKLSDVKIAYSHLVLLPQCGKFLRKNNITGAVSPDNARAARDVAQKGDANVGALASELAAGVYGLDILARHIEDNDHNTTRFLVMAPEADLSRRGAHGMITSFVFRVRNIPAALYKGLGGFATNSINMTKLESYMVDGSFTATQFYADVEGHPEDTGLKNALEELDYFTSELKILGVYPAHEKRY